MLLLILGCAGLTVVGCAIHPLIGSAVAAVIVTLSGCAALAQPGITERGRLYAGHLPVAVGCLALPVIAYPDSGLLAGALLSIGGVAAGVYLSSGVR